jgi:hypothetical protein
MSLGIRIRDVRWVRAIQIPEAHFRLAVALARDYRDTADAAGRTLDPEFTWPLDVLEQMNQLPKEEE